jgi:RNA polymerase sigma factor (sigma-70 family)
VANGRLNTVFHHLYRVAGGPLLAEAGDGQLLERFVNERDPRAFDALLQRHGAMVLHVCRRVLGHAQDAEDAFQATFLLLAKSAASIRRQASVASWLYGVAYRLAARAKTLNARRQVREQRAVLMRQQDPGLEAARRELQTLLDEELHRLPPRFQAALVLCYLEGKTHDEAARQLGWPLGTVRSRVARARELLRTRLARRGLALPAATLATLLAADVSRAVPAQLFAATYQAALTFAGGHAAAAELVSPQAAALVEGGVTALTATHFKLGLALVLLVGLGAVGLGALKSRPPPAPATGGAEAAPAIKRDQIVKVKGKTRRTDRRDASLPVGARARLGTARFWAGGMVYDGRTLTFSGDGKEVALTGSDGAIYLWEAATGKGIARIADPGRPNGRPRLITFMALSPHGHTLATVGQPGEVRLWDVRKAREIRRLGGKQPPKVTACVFSPNGKVLASPGTDGVVYRWQAATGQALPPLKGHEGPVDTVAFSPNGRFLASGGDDQTARLWNAATGKQVRTLEGHRDRVVGLAFSPDGKTLASRSTDNTIRLWVTRTGKELRQWPSRLRYWYNNQGNTYLLTFSRDGKTLGAASFDGLRLYETATGRLAQTRQPTGAKAVTLSPGGNIVAGLVNLRLHLWDFTTGKAPFRTDGHEGGVLTTVFSPDGSKLATGGADGLIRLWDRASGKELRQLRGHTGVVSCLCFSPDGKYLASASSSGNDRAVSWWKIGGKRRGVHPPVGREARQFRGHGPGVRALALTTGGKRLAALDGRGTLFVWDTATGKVLRRKAGFPPSLAAFSADGKLLARWGWARRGQDLALEVATAEKGATARRLPLARGAGVAYLAFAPDGRTLLTVTYNASLILWDVKSGQLRRWLRRLEPLVTSYQAFQSAAAFSPDGKMLAVPGKDRETVGLLELATGKERHVFRGGQGSISSLAFSPDGATLASGSLDGTTLLWDVKAAPAKAELTAKVLEGLWADLAADDAVRAYRAICTLRAGPPQAVPFLQKKIRPAGAEEMKQVDRFIADLGSQRFATRRQAQKALEKLGPRARPALVKALQGNPSLDLRQRLEGLLKRLDLGKRSGADLRLLRAVEALEAMGTAPARRLFREWSRGAAGALLTEEARAALARLERNGRR